MGIGVVAGLVGRAAELARAEVMRAIPEGGSSSACPAQSLGFRHRALPVSIPGRHEKSPQEYCYPLRINRRWGNQPALGDFRALVRKPNAAWPTYSAGAALCVCQETSMNYSIYGADRTTHLKVVIVALIAGILVAGFSILMDEGLTARVMKTGKPVMVTTSNKNVKS
jgi:hypothetical protein